MITAPWPAASIISPMIEVPPTVWPSRITRTVASKLSAHLTNLAEARACRPLRLRIVTSALGLLLFNTTDAFSAQARSSGLSGEHLARHADVLAASLFGRIHGRGQLGLAAHAGELDQHRQVDTRQHLGAGLCHDRYRQIGGGAAEHVREHDDAAAG